MDNLYLIGEIAHERHANAIRRAEANGAWWHEINRSARRRSDGILGAGVLSALLLAALIVSQTSRLR